MEALAKEHIEVAGKVMAKQTELAQLEVELEDARRLIMQPTPPPTSPSSQAPRGHTSPRVSDAASSGMAVDAELLLPTEGEVKGPKRLRVGTTGEEAPSLQQVLAAQRYVLFARPGVHHGLFPATSLTAGGRIDRE